MTSNTFDLYEFRHSILLAIQPQDVYRYIASSRGICSWFIGEAVYMKPGGEVLGAEKNSAKGDSFRWKWLSKELQVYIRKEFHCFNFAYGAKRQNAVHPASKLP